MLNPKTMAKATIGTMGKMLAVPSGNAEQARAMSLLKHQGQTAEGGRDR